MKGAIIIAEKDLRGVFASPLFYIVAAICSLMWWLSYTSALGGFIQSSAMRSVQSQGQAGPLPIHFYVTLDFFRVVNLVMLFAVGALTMRLFTEEKRNRTFDLLLTAPVTATEIVMGKLIAGVLTAWALLAVSCLYPLSLALFGGMEWGPFASAVLGLALVFASYVAIGMFASSLTQSAVVAVILSIVFNILFWFMGAASSAASDPTERAILDQLNIGQHLQTFLTGGVSLSGAVFLLSLVVFFTFLTQRVVESSRWR